MPVPDDGSPADETSESTEEEVDPTAGLSATELADNDAIYPKNIPFSREQIRNGASIIYILSKFKTFRSKNNQFVKALCTVSWEFLLPLSTTLTHPSISLRWKECYRPNQWMPPYWPWLILLLSLSSLCAQYGSVFPTSESQLSCSRLRSTPSLSKVRFSLCSTFTPL